MTDSMKSTKASAPAPLPVLSKQLPSGVLVGQREQADDHLPSSSAPR
ncbi:hypothetical protein [Microbispora catharanthi]|nr:hypothetical protein [Microbispora catharanthi]